MTDYSQTALVPAAPDTEPSPALKEKAADTAKAAKQAGAEVAETAADKATDVAAEAKRQARDLLGEARQQVRQQASDQQRNLVSNLRLLGDELRGMTQHSQQPGVATELASQARDRMQGLADWLDRREPGDVLEEIRALARRRPGAFLLGTALAGVVAGRMTRGLVAADSDDSPGSGIQAHHGMRGPAAAGGDGAEVSP